MSKRASRAACRHEANGRTCRLTVGHDGLHQSAGQDAFYLWADDGTEFTPTDPTAIARLMQRLHTPNDAGDCAWCKSRTGQHHPYPCEFVEAAEFVLDESVNS